MRQAPTLSAEEQARRRQAMNDALVNVRLEGLEPDPIFFVYVDRYVRGEITLTDAIADYTARLTAIVQVK
jgi:hypothetical protein